MSINVLLIALSSKLSKLQHKCVFYLVGALRAMVPATVWLHRRDAIFQRFEKLTLFERDVIESRVNYYNRLQSPFAVPEGSDRIGNFTSRNKSSAYCSDFKSYIRFFPQWLRVGYLFGDITNVPDCPHVLKSRPIADDQSNANSVLLKLNRIRHYYFVKDRLRFAEKKPQVVWRGKSNCPDRIAFAMRYGDHPLCNIGCVRHKEATPEPYLRDFLTIEEQLGYQFIVSVEGIDVATNLKWIMASNSLCLMRRPRFETWFMEGTLIPGYHYVELRDDFSDLPEQVAYYRENPEEAKAIVKNAKRHVEQFMNRTTETMIAVLVIRKYFWLSGQIGDPGPQRNRKPRYRWAYAKKEPRFTPGRL